jgi:PEP-CTERM motif
MRPIKHILWFLICLSLLSTAADAGTLYDNLSATSNGEDPLADVFFGPLSDSFSTGGSAVALTDVKVLLRLEGAAQGIVTISLLSDNATTPGSTLLSIGSLSDTSIPSVATVFDFPVASYNLASNTRYWIQLDSTDASDAAWRFSNDTSGTGVANEYFYNHASIIINGGAAWPNSDGPYQMQVNVGSATVPEPTSVILLGAGLGSIVVVTRFRKRWAA